MRAQLAFVIALFLGALWNPAAVAAQESARVARVGYLADSPYGPLREPFRHGLRDLGYVEGRNLVIERRYAEGKLERYPALANELVLLKVDVIVAAGGTPAAVAAKRATGSVPVVFVGVGDPVTSGLVASLGRPGGNVTGLSVVAPDLISKRLELLTQAVPGVSRVAVLWHPGALEERTEKDRLARAETAGALGLRLHFVEARDASELDRPFRI